MEEPFRSVPFHRHQAVDQGPHGQIHTHIDTHKPRSAERRAWEQARAQQPRSVTVSCRVEDWRSGGACRDATVEGPHLTACGSTFSCI